MYNIKFSTRKAMKTDSFFAIYLLVELSVPFVVDDGNGILRELDIVEPLPCWGDNEVLVSTADLVIDSNITDPMTPPWEDVILHVDSDDPSCPAEEGLRHKRHIWNDAVDWGSKTIAYTIEDTFSKCDKK